MIVHYIEGGYTYTSYLGRASSITDAADVSFSLAVVVVRRGISHIGGWIGIALVFQHADAGATSVGGVGVPFDAKAMRGVAELTSLSV